MKTQYTKRENETNGSGPTTKAPSHRDRILSLLRERGPAGITNLELNGQVCLRYGARVFELRRMGYQIDTHREGESTFRFILREEPAQLKPLPRFDPIPKISQPGLFPSEASE